MEIQRIVDIIFMVGLTAICWLLRELWSSIKELRDAVANIRADLPTYYVAKSDYRADIQEVKEMLGRICARQGK